MPTKNRRKPAPPLPVDPSTTVDASTSTTVDASTSSPEGERYPTFGDPFMRTGSTSSTVDPLSRGDTSTSSTSSAPADGDRGEHDELRGLDELDERPRAIEGISVAGLDELDDGARCCFYFLAAYQGRPAVIRCRHARYNRGDFCTAHQRETGVFAIEARAEHVEAPAELDGSTTSTEDPQ
jgi:hypothetical protein